MPPAAATACCVGAQSISPMISPPPGVVAGVVACGAAAVAEAPRSPAFVVVHRDGVGDKRGGGEGGDGAGGDGGGGAATETTIGSSATGAVPTTATPRLLKGALGLLATSAPHRTLAEAHLISSGSAPACIAGSGPRGAKKDISGTEPVTPW
jgi:hypothetical protein